MGPTETEDNCICAEDEWTPGAGEEVTDATEHHKHAHGDVDKTAALDQYWHKCIQEELTYKMFVKSIAIVFLKGLWDGSDPQGCSRINVEGE